MMWDKNQNTPNQVANVLKGCAWVIWVLGFILGIIMGMAENAIKEMMDLEPSFEFGTALAYWVVAFMGGMMLYFFGELLQKVDDLEHCNQRQRECMEKMDKNLQALADLLAHNTESDGQVRKDGSIPPASIREKNKLSVEKIPDNPEKKAEERVNSVPKKDIMTGENYLVCPFCGVEQPATNKTCVKCNAKFTE